jgi:hypothetical protein
MENTFIITYFQKIIPEMRGKICFLVKFCARGKWGNGIHRSLPVKTPGIIL